MRVRSINIILFGGILLRLPKFVVDVLLSNIRGSKPPAPCVEQVLGNRGCEMPVVQVEAQLSPEELLAAVEQLSGTELEQFALELNALIARRKAPSLPQAESELLLKINQSVPPDVQQRYDELIATRQAETLTNDEYDELLHLTQQVENFAAQRVACLAELARLRATSLTTLMEELGIKAPVYG